MGTTYKALDTRRKKHVALKTIDDKLLADLTSRRRFFNEARTASNLEHPNIVRVDHVCDDNAEVCFYVMEWVDGESLGERVKKSGTLPPREALLLLRAVADALTVLGEQRLVHRDIKPDNIMVARAGRAASRVKLIDFGLAKALEQSPSRGPSMDTGARFVGSLYFASPEQICGRAELDCRSDFYSLGTTLWWVLTGSPPFTGTTFEVQKGHVEEEPPWTKIAQFPACIQKLLRHLLAKDPAQRPADAATLLTEWDEVLAELETASPHRLREEAHSDGDSQPHPIDVSTAPVVAVTVIQALPGCDSPPAHARLARDAATGDWVAICSLPPALAPESRWSFLAAARVAQAAQHSGLLNVRDVRDEEVIREWPPSVAATRILAAHHGALPLGVVLAWLPKLATTIDWGCQHGFSRMGLSPARWQVVFETLAENETPAARAARAPGEWGPHYVFLDPLAGFDPDFAVAAMDQESKDITPLPKMLETPADYLAALARALHKLLGGRDQERVPPLPALNQSSNELLVVAIRGQADFGSVSEWAEAFVKSAHSDLRLPRAERSEPKHAPITTLSTSPQLTTKQRGNLRIAVAALAIVLAVAAVWNQQHGALRRKPLSTPAPDLIPALLADATTALTVHDFTLAEEKLTAAETHSPGDERVAGMRAGLEKEQLRFEVDALLTEAGTAVATHDFPLALKKIAAAETRAPNDQRIAELHAEVENEKQRLAAETQRRMDEQKRQTLATALATARTLFAAAQLDPTPAKIDAMRDATKAALDLNSQDEEVKTLLADIGKFDSLQKAIQNATTDAPFENSLGMKFVPVSITGGPTEGKRVLFCIWETRVKDFTAFVEATGHDATKGFSSYEIKISEGFNWKRPGFEQTGDHPVVGVNPDDANAFCEWLTKLDHTNQKLPMDYSYRLPSDTEWSAAVGKDTYPWGNKSLTPPGAGNYAGAEMKGDPAWVFDFIANYNDGFLRTSPVGRFKPNPYGLYDMGGNVNEWCEAWETRDRTKEIGYSVLGQKYTVGRGASWRDMDGHGYDYDRDRRKSSYRHGRYPWSRGVGRDSDTGFRVVVANSPIPLEN